MQKAYFRLLLQIDVPVLLNTSPLQWLDHQTIHLAKQAVFLLLHSKESSDQAEKYREDASTFYNSAIEQLGWCKKWKWGTGHFDICALYLCIYEAVRGNEEGAEMHLKYLLSSTRHDSYKFVCFFMSLLPPEWECYDCRGNRLSTVYDK